MNSVAIGTLDITKANVVDVEIKQNVFQSLFINGLIDFPETAIFLDETFFTRKLTFVATSGVIISGSSFMNNYQILDRTTNFSPYMAFNKYYTNSGGLADANEYGWRSEGSFNPKINFGTPIYQTSVDGLIVGRQWLSIELPSPQKFEGFKMFCKIGNEAEHPRTYHVCGSNDGLNFASLYYVANEIYNTSKYVQRLFTNTGSYRFYRVVIINANPPSTSIINHSCNIQEFMLCASPPSTTTLATKTSFNELYNSHMALIALLERWIKNGTLLVSGLIYINNPILEHM
jgi:hypothetical protein